MVKHGKHGDVGNMGTWKHGDVTLVFAFGGVPPQRRLLPGAQMNSSGREFAEGSECPTLPRFM